METRTRGGGGTPVRDGTTRFTPPVSPTGRATDAATVPVTLGDTEPLAESVGDSEPLAVTLDDKDAVCVTVATTLADVLGDAATLAEPLGDDDAVCVEVAMTLADGVSDTVNGDVDALALAVTVAVTVDATLPDTELVGEALRLALALTLRLLEVEGEGGVPTINRITLLLLSATMTLPALETPTPRGPLKDAKVPTPFRNPPVQERLPANVVTSFVAMSILRMTLLEYSLTYKFPAESAAIPCGSKNCAFVPIPSTTVFNGVMMYWLPARVVTVWLATSRAWTIGL